MLQTSHLVQTIAQVEGKDKQSIVDNVRILDMQLKQKQDGSNFGSGMLITTDQKKINFKIWDDAMTKQLEKDLEDGAIVAKIEGTSNVYGGNFGVFIDAYTILPPDILSVEVFLETPYNQKELLERSKRIYNTYLSEKGLSLLLSFLQSNKEVSKRLVEEFCAKSHHDAVRYGLLAHTTKMMEIAELMVKIHPNFVTTEEEKDLLFVGLFLHDIGKTLELNYGAMTKESLVTHRLLGAELIIQFKEEIIKAYNEMWYYELLAILTQHHGIYAERPRTVLVWLIHLIDNFEAQTTDLSEKLEADARPIVVMQGNERLYLQSYETKTEESAPPQKV